MDSGHLTRDQMVDTGHMVTPEVGHQTQGNVARNDNIRVEIVDRQVSYYDTDD